MEGKLGPLYDQGEGKGSEAAQAVEQGVVREVGKEVDWIVEEENTEGVRCVPGWELEVEEGGRWAGGQSGSEEMSCGLGPHCLGKMFGEGRVLREAALRESAAGLKIHPLEILTLLKHVFVSLLSLISTPYIPVLISAVQPEQKYKVYQNVKYPCYFFYRLQHQSQSS
jgi:hypothetical protein